MSSVADRVDGVVATLIAQEVDILHEDVFVQNIAAEGAVVLINAVAYLERGEGIADILGVFLFFFARDGLRVGHAAHINVVDFLRCEVGKRLVCSEKDFAVEGIKAAVCVTFGKGGEVFHKECGKGGIVRFVVVILEIVLQIDRLTVVGIGDRFVELFVFRIFKNIAFIVGIYEIISLIGIGYVGCFGRFFGGGGLKIDAVEKHQKEKHKEGANERENAFFIHIFGFGVLFHRRMTPFLFGV